MDLDSLNVFLLVGALVLVAAVIAVREVNLGLPSLVLYLLIGLLLRVGHRYRVRRCRARLVLGYAALVVILAEGGLTTRCRCSVRSRR